MIKYFCDICGEEIKNRAIAMKLELPVEEEVEIKANGETLFTLGKSLRASTHFICKKCQSELANFIENLKDEGKENK